MGSLVGGVETMWPTRKACNERGNRSGGSRKRYKRHAERYVYLPGLQSLQDADVGSVGTGRG
jgi:hypothetical protein